MALDEYARKRRFENTPEPPPSAGASKHSANYYCVQRHDATRLHYDFRLGIDGVLKSWAVPKGPTLDPGVKHLAAHVEDHPMEYGGFEGTIPAGNYGAGSVMLWDRGTFELLGEESGEAQMARGDLKFRLHGEKLNGDFALVLMKGDDSPCRVGTWNSTRTACSPAAPRKRLQRIYRRVRPSARQQGPPTRS